LNIDAFILIGGRSVRFGSDKAFIEFGGQTLASRIAATVEEAFPGIRTTFVAASEDQFGIKTSSLKRGLIFDLKKGFGAWSGLDAALSNSKAEWTLVLACDLPFVTAEFLRQLYESTRAGIDAVVPRQVDDRLQPLCAMYRTTIVRTLVAEIMDAETVPPLSSIFQRVKTAILDTAADVLRNVNTPEDLLDSVSWPHSG
jgi:molybdopterin-guanine dinucleotide biosynthesis protein A